MLPGRQRILLVTLLLNPRHSNDLEEKCAKKIAFFIAKLM